MLKKLLQNNPSKNRQITPKQIHPDIVIYLVLWHFGLHNKTNFWKWWVKRTYIHVYNTLISIGIVLVCLQVYIFYPGKHIGNF